MAKKGNIGTSMTTHKLRKPKGKYYTEKEVDLKLKKKELQKNKRKPKGMTNKEWLKYLKNETNKFVDTQE